MGLHHELSRELETYRHTTGAFPWWPGVLAFVVTSLVLVLITICAPGVRPLLGPVTGASDVPGVIDASPSPKVVVASFQADAPAQPREPSAPPSPGPEAPRAPEAGPGDAPSAGETRLHFEDVGVPELASKLRMRVILSLADGRRRLVQSTAPVKLDEEETAPATASSGLIVHLDVSSPAGRRLHQDWLAPFVAAAGQSVKSVEIEDPLGRASRLVADAAARFDARAGEAARRSARRVVFFRAAGGEIGVRIEAVPAGAVPSASAAGP